MGGFLSGFFDRVGDFADGVSGRTESKNLNSQLEQQADLNEKLIELAKQEIAYKESPAYLAAQQKKTIIAAIVMIAAIIGAVLIFRYSKD